MAKSYSITIIDGKGSARLLNGNYNVTTNVDGYDNLSITPSSIQVTSDSNIYTFNVSASGVFNIRVTEE